MDEGYVNVEKYKKMVRDIAPKSKIYKDCIFAFVVGGTISLIGEIIEYVLLTLGADITVVGSYTTIILIFLGVLFTGIGLYKKLGKYAGAGSIVPITGFANAVASSAMEFKKEGIIVGIGSKMFILAGPVIVYGIISSIVVGGIYYLVVGIL